MAFNQLQIIANGNYLDTYDNWDVALTYQIQDIVDITKKTTSFSKTILIPGTKTNNEFFQNIFDVNVGRRTDDTLFALQAGSVKFGSRRGRRVVDIVPAE